jgi:hypothetical protein
MNTVAILPSLCLHFLQKQNVKRSTVKQATTTMKQNDVHTNDDNNYDSLQTKPKTTTATIEETSVVTAATVTPMTLITEPEVSTTNPIPSNEINEPPGSNSL